MVKIVSGVVQIVQEVVKIVRKGIKCPRELFDLHAGTDKETNILNIPGVWIRIKSNPDSYGSVDPDPEV